MKWLIVYFIVYYGSIVYHIVHLIFFQQRGTIITLPFPKLSSAYSYYGITRPKTSSATALPAHRAPPPLPTVVIDFTHYFLIQTVKQFTVPEMTFLAGCRLIQQEYAGTARHDASALLLAVRASLDVPTSSPLYQPTTKWEGGGRPVPPPGDFCGRTWMRQQNQRCQLPSTIL